MKRMANMKKLMFCFLVFNALKSIVLSAQTAPVTLELEVERQHVYVFDGTEYSKLALNPDRTAIQGAVRTFAPFVNIGDIVAVNGRRVRGTLVISQTTLRLSPTLALGSNPADVERLGEARQTWEIQQEDGTPIGSIMTAGLTFGSPPPGASAEANGGNFAIVGGTGAFMGIRGQISTAPAKAPSAARNSSVSEDPVNRRSFGIGTARYIAQIIPYSRPEVIVNDGVPAIVHANDFSNVTALKPAKAGELLILYATGLGPTRPSIPPGQPFPVTPLATANSPIDITINGIPAEVVWGGGFPGSTDGYHVSFRVPTGISSGLARLQLAVAWVAGLEVRVPVQ
jgi:uncharacterized protein (TIGR03437 family)